EIDLQMLLRTLSFLLFLLPGLTAFAGEGDARGSICPRDSGRFADTRAKANAGDPPAQAALASCYELGRNVSPSRADAIHWLTLAAERGYAPAQYELGRIYLYGRGVPADYDRAFLWEKRAAERGEPRAQRDLAYMYERGLGVEADPARAAAWNRKAAMQGL